MTVKNGTTKDVVVCSLSNNAQLVDQATGDSWKPVNTGGSLALCDNLSASHASGLWMQFKIPNPENNTSGKIQAAHSVMLP
jgi:hypothetical protein